MAAELKYTDEELATACLKAQEQNPLFTETAIMGVLRLGKDYLRQRSKKSEIVDEARQVMAGIREAAWCQKLVSMLTNKGANATLAIWITRNTLGWRDEMFSHEDTARREAEAVKQLNGTDYLVLLKQRQEKAS